LVRVFTLAGLAVLCLGQAPPRHSLAVPESEITRIVGALDTSAARRESSHFVIVYDGSTGWAKSTSNLLEQTYDSFKRFMDHLGVRHRRPESKLVAVLIEEHERFRAFAAAQDGVRAEWLGGYYYTATNRVVFYDSMTAPEFAAALREIDAIEVEADEAQRRATVAQRDKKPQAAEAYRTLAISARQGASAQRTSLHKQARDASYAKTTHEAAHLLAFNCGLQSRSHQYPFWLSEGLATCFEATSTPSGKAQPFGPEHVNSHREEELADAIASNTLVPLEAFVEMVAVPGGEEETARIMYAQGYSLFRYLYRYEREKLAGLFADIAREPQGMISPRRQGELFQARFGDPRRVERLWLREIKDLRRLAEVPVEP